MNEYYVSFTEGCPISGQFDSSMTRTPFGDGPTTASFEAKQLHLS